MARRFIERQDLTGALREHLPGRHLAGLARLAGGSKKGVYRLAFGDGSTMILYAWNRAENYWPASSDPADDPFSDATGAAEFVACHAALTAAGVRVPYLHVLDRSRVYYPADLALVEDVRGGSLEDLLARDTAAGQAPLARLGSTLRAMHRHTGARFGKVGLVAAGDSTVDGGQQEARPEDVVARRALRHLDAAAARVAGLAAAKPELTQLVLAMRAAVLPRREYGLVHGELGPDHVLLDDDGDPVLIDIEGLTYFDVEWEHAFLRLRFDDAGYSRLGLPAVDESRVAFYDLAQRLSLIEGPLRIAETDYPERDWMLELAEYHVRGVLAAVQSRDRRDGS